MSPLCLSKCWVSNIDEKRGNVTPCWKGKAINRDQTTDDSNVEFSRQEWKIMMNGQIGNLNIDIESLKMNQFEILEVKNIISE